MKAKIIQNFKILVGIIFPIQYYSQAFSFFLKNNIDCLRLAITNFQIFRLKNDMLAFFIIIIYLKMVKGSLLYD